jgi:hypothetical protein
MKRSTVALIAALAVFETIRPAACAYAQAAAPFEQVPLSTPHQSHWASTLAFGAGIGLIGASFLLSDEADQRYEDYQQATNPDEINSLYDETLRLDHYANASLLSGEVLVATGIYLRFIRRPAPVQLRLGPRRCAVSFRF